MSRSDAINILHVTPAFHPAYIYGGPIESVYQLCRQLAQQGCRVQVLTSNANGRDRVVEAASDCDVPLEDGLQVRYCRRRFGQMIAPTLVSSMARYVRRADLVHLTGVYSFPTIPTLLACRLLNKPLVWSPRGALQRWERSRRTKAKLMWESVCKAAAPNRLTIHVTSEEEAESARSRFRRAHIAVIPNGVQIPETIVPEPPGMSLRMLYLGRLDPKKGIENLLEACSLMTAASDLEWSLTVAGGGAREYQDTLARTVSRLELSRQVALVGEVSGCAKARALAAADVLIVPSHTENFGIVVAEALAHGVPVIASTGTPWQRLVSMGCGLWVENSPASLAGAIRQISRMPLRDMGRIGREWMVKEFSWSRIAEDMRACYGRLLRGGDDAGV